MNYAIILCLLFQIINATEKFEYSNRRSKHKTSEIFFQKLTNYAYDVPAFTNLYEQYENDKKRFGAIDVCEEIKLEQYFHSCWKQEQLQLYLTNQIEPFSFSMGLASYCFAGYLYRYSSNEEIPLDTCFMLRLQLAPLLIALGTLFLYDGLAPIKKIQLRIGSLEENYHRAFPFKRRLNEQYNVLPYGRIS